MNNKLENKNTVRILFSNVLYKSGKMIFYIFLNIFVWKKTNDLKIVSLFNITFLSFHLVSFFIFASIVKKGKNILLNNISLFGSAFVYLMVLLLGENSINYIYFISAGMGIFSGMYWINYHVVQFILTSFHNRGNFQGLRKTLVGVSKIIIPSLIGLIIARNYFEYGYEISFGIGMILFIISAFLGNIKLEKNINTKFRFKELKKEAFNNKNVFTSLYTYSLSGFSFGSTVIEIIIGLIIFNKVLVEDKLGFILSGLSIVSIIAMYFFGKFVSYKKYSKTIIFLGLGYTISLLGLISFDNLFIILLFSALVGIFTDFFSIPQKVISDNVLHEIKEYKEFKTEYMVLREIFLGIGWLPAFGVLYFMDGVEVEQLKNIFIVIIILGLIATWKLSGIKLKEK